MPRAGPLALLLVLSGCAAPQDPAPVPSEPYVLVAYGDSFTSALDTLAMTDRPELSWATGTLDGLNSVHQRLAERLPSVSSHNLAVSGYRTGHLPEEVARGPGAADLVLVFMGINDVCAPDVALESFRETTRAGFDAVADAHPGATVLVFELTDLKRMRALHAGDEALRLFWERSIYCRGLLSETDPQGIAEAAARWTQFNAVLADEAVDRGFRVSEAFVWPGFTRDDLAILDGFHPNERGEARLAAAAWGDIQAVL